MKKANPLTIAGKLQIGDVFMKIETTYENTFEVIAKKEKHILAKQGELIWPNVVPNDTAVLKLIKQTN